jgi:hypothetical protein
MYKTTYFTYIPSTSIKDSTYDTSYLPTYTHYHHHLSPAVNILVITYHRHHHHHQHRHHTNINNKTAITIINDDRCIRIARRFTPYLRLLTIHVPISSHRRRFRL